MGKSVKQISAAIVAAGGNVSAAARLLGLTRRAVQKRIANSAELAAIVQDERERLVDLAESQLESAIHRGDMAAIIWTLKANPAAKKRGWGERTEITDGEGQPVPIAIVKMSVDEL